jgi:hypothetical protein
MTFIDSSTNIPAVQIKEGTTPANAAAGTQKIFIDSSSHHLKRLNSSGTVVDIEGGGGATPDYISIEDHKASGTDGGTFTSGAWQTRDLNTTVSDTGSHVVSLASNQFVLDAGTYEIEVDAPAYKCDYHAIRLQNITDSTTILSGSSEYANSTYNVANRSFISGKFVIAASKTLQIQHRCGTTASGNGLGVGAGASFAVATEIYTRVRLWKVA